MSVCKEHGPTVWYCTKLHKPREEKCVHCDRNLAEHEGNVDHTCPTCGASCPGFVSDDAVVLLLDENARLRDEVERLKFTCNVTHEQGFAAQDEVIRQLRTEVSRLRHE